MFYILFGSVIAFWTIYFKAIFSRFNVICIFLIGLHCYLCDR